jgi:uncharacterized integral membrane protein
MSTEGTKQPAAGNAGRPRRGASERARGAAILVLVVVMTVFAVLNLKDVEVNWIVGSGRAPLIIVIVISLLVGVVVTYFAERRSRRRD